MAKLRIDFSRTPGYVQDQFGRIKNKDGIISALTYWDGCAHAKEIFAFLNCKDPAKAHLAKHWLKVRKLNKRTGVEEETVPVSFQTVSNELAAMLDRKMIKHVGNERSGLYALLDFDENQLEDEEADADDSRETDETDEPEEDEDYA